MLTYKCKEGVAYYITALPTVYSLAVWCLSRGVTWLSEVVMSALGRLLHDRRL